MNRRNIGLRWLSVCFLAMALLSLTTCAGTREIGVAPTSAVTETHSITPTMSLLLSPTVEPTPVRVTADDRYIPWGLIYQAADALWRVNADGERVKMLTLLDDAPMGMGPGPAISLDGAQVLYEETDDIWLVDVATGERRNLTQTPNRSECCAQWWPEQPDLILFNSWTSEVSGPNLGFPTVVRPDGGGYRVLGGERVAFTLPAPSPDGRTVAYDRAGRPWLYRMDAGPQPLAFDLTSYDPLSDPPVSVVSPSWSPDGARLAWVVGGDFAALGGWRLGIGVLDLQVDTVSLLHPYEPLGRGGWPSAPVWSPDGQWLVFAAWAQDGDEAGIWVMRADGEDEHHLACSCSNQAWSPDGRWLACTSKPQGLGVWLVEAGTWEPHPLDLPFDTRLVDWIDPTGNR